jgi:hypothetical protein
MNQGKANANQMWGLMVLLVSKLAGYPATGNWVAADFDDESGILKKQRLLAEAVEITSTGNDIHQNGVLNMQQQKFSATELDNDNLLVFGNKVCPLK